MQNGLTYQLVDLDDNTAIEHISGSNDLFTVYPNPVYDQINVTVGDIQSITLTSINGSQLYQTSENKINFQNYPAGLYLLNIKGKRGEKVVKKIIKR